MKLERLHKVIAASGLTSRRKAEELILEGAVTVNGKRVTELGTKVNPAEDAIKVSGKLLTPSDVELHYVMLNKPSGVVSTLSDPEGRPTIAEHLRLFPQRLLPVGRLDFTSEGLILMTNDGEMMNRIMKAKHLNKTYRIKAKGHFRPEDLEFMTEGVFTTEGALRFKTIKLDEKLKNKTWITLEVSEGSTLNIREILNHRGILVDRIVRSAVGPVEMGELGPGEWRELTKEELAKLTRAIDGTETVEKVDRAEIVSGYKATRKLGTLSPWADRRRQEKRDEERGSRFGDRPDRAFDRNERSERNSDRPSRFGDDERRGPRRPANVFVNESNPRHRRPEGKPSRISDNVVARRVSELEAAQDQKEDRRFDRRRNEGQGGFDRRPRNAPPGRGGFDRPAPRTRSYSTESGESRGFPRRPREGGSEGRSFERRPSRDGGNEGRSFSPRPRDGGGEGRSFERRPPRDGARSAPGRSFERRPPRDGGSEGRSFSPRPRDGGGEGRSFERRPPRDGARSAPGRSGEGRSFDRRPSGSAGPRRAPIRGRS